MELFVFFRLKISSVLKPELKLIEEALQRGQVTGVDRFLEEIPSRLGIRLSDPHFS